MTELTPYKNLQEVFDIVYRGLAAQGFTRSTKIFESRSSGLNNGLKNEFCAYRSEDGSRKCAIGQLVPDDFVTVATAGLSVGRLLSGHSNFYEWKNLFANIYTGQLSTLQYAHDQGMTPEIMQLNLATFAFDYKLTIPTENSEEVK